MVVVRLATGYIIKSFAALSLQLEQENACQNHLSLAFIETDPEEIFQSSLQENREGMIFLFKVTGVATLGDFLIFGQLTRHYFWKNEPKIE